jgi:hypothetical protein
MIRFHQFILLKENSQAQEIESIFNKAAIEIRELFNQLIKGTTDMVKNYERSRLPEEIKKQIVNDLNRIIKKVNGPVTESVILKNIVENISYAINESMHQDVDVSPPSIIQGVGSHKTGDSGRKAYNFTSVINNIYKHVMDRMTQLKSAVLQHLGLLGDIHKGVGEIPSHFDKLGTRFDKLDTDVSDIGKGVKGVGKSIADVRKTQDTTASIQSYRPAKTGPQLDMNAWRLAVILSHFTNAKLADHPGKFSKSKDIGKLYSDIKLLALKHGRVTLNAGKTSIPLQLDELETTQLLDSLLERKTAGAQRAKEFLSQNPSHDAWAAGDASDATIKARADAEARKKAAGERLKELNRKRKKNDEI